MSMMSRMGGRPEGVLLTRRLCNRAFQPLLGKTVVALEQAVAAPLCTRMLADAGARVIKIERDGGDFARGYDTHAKGATLL